MRAVLFVGLFSMILLAESMDMEIDINHVKCLVCRATMKEVDVEVLKDHPDVLVNVGGFRMDAQGNTVYKEVPLRQSEVHISEILDNICEKMNDYVRVIGKYDNRLRLVNLLSSPSVMNPELSDVEVIQDGDLNKSLPYYCGVIVGEYEDDIISLYVNKEDNKTERFCTNISRICEKYVDENEDSETDSITERPGHTNEEL
ncbi:protein seele [Ooceraea biroi]|uniref:Canopy-like protein n=1 Tax=Ooceraea biroi TaxID=2015173 RepID=A0A026WNY7_OOCBI|nr:protein seele [Ooceraea biroi]EZA57730.1 Canopy-like protein [Ooceraea biroi]